MASRRGTLRGFLEELGRRKVPRAAAVYGVVAWAVIEASSVILPVLGLPEEALRLIVVLGIGGFPVAMAAAWLFDLTPDPGPGATGPFRRVPALAGLAVVGVASTVSIWFISKAAASAFSPGPSALSIAVLPFANHGEDPDNAFFATGVHEDVLSQLAVIHELSVISRTSVMQYRDAQRSLREIGRELGVAYVVEGSVRRDAGRVRVVAQLFDARTDESLWAETYDRTLDDIFAVQSELALSIASALHATLTPDERERIVSRPTDNLTAYEMFLRGRALEGAADRDRNEAAIELFKQAIQLDPGFAEAYAALALAYNQRAYGFGFPVEWADSARVAAQEAMRLDPGLAEAHGYLGIVLFLSGRYGEARRVARRAIDLKPSFARAINLLGVIELVRWNPDRAIEHFTRALRVEPTSSSIPVNLGIAHWYLGNTAEAEVWFARGRERGFAEPEPEARRALASAYAGAADTARARAEALLLDFPGNFRASHAAATTFWLIRDFERARTEFEALYRRNPDARPFIQAPSIRASYGLALLQAGETARGRALLDTAMVRAERAVADGDERWEVRAEIAMVHASAGRIDDAIQWLHRAREVEGRHHLRLRTDPAFDPLRGEPAFEALVSEMEAYLEAARARVAGGAVASLPE